MTTDADRAKAAELVTMSPPRSDINPYWRVDLIAAALAEARAPYDRLTAGAALIAAERQRQIADEGWTPEHDAEHWDDDLALAAVCYATPPSRRELLTVSAPQGWPWRDRDWKPSPDDRVRELVKAGALIAAEIERLQAQDGSR